MQTAKYLASLDMAMYRKPPYGGENLLFRLRLDMGTRALLKVGPPYKTVAYSYDPPYKTVASYDPPYKTVASCDPQYKTASLVVMVRRRTTVFDHTAHRRS